VEELHVDQQPNPNLALPNNHAPATVREVVEREVQLKEDLSVVLFGLDLKKITIIITESSQLLHPRSLSLVW